MIIHISLNIYFTLPITEPHDKLKMKVINTNIMKVLGPLVINQYFDGDLDLDEYNNSIYEAHSNEYIYGL